MCTIYYSSFLEKMKVASFSFPEVKGWVAIFPACKPQGLTGITPSGRQKSALPAETITQEY